MVDVLEGWGLRPVTLADRPVFDAYFGTLAGPLSDYTFSQFYTWRNSLRILWKEMAGHLCVFANGAGDLTMLAPPIGDAGGERALDEAWALMDEYNALKGVRERSRVEYVSEELLARLGGVAGLEVGDLGQDYVYDVGRMIDLAGGDLASKRQAKNRFMRNYRYRVEAYERGRHLGQCLNLLGEWKSYQDAAALGRGEHARSDVSGLRKEVGDEHPTNLRVQVGDEHPSRQEVVRAGAVKREKESLAAELTVDAAEQLGLKGMVVWVEGPDGVERVRGFTFGEELGRDQSSITVEKTDLGVKGLAQFIFSEFCAREWGGRPLVNVGDDWGLESLAWTKMSYRPVKLMKKFTLKRVPVVKVAVGGSEGSGFRVQGSGGTTEVSSGAGVTVRAVSEGDLGVAEELERACFTAHSLKRRQLKYLTQHAVFLVAEEGGKVIGDGIALVRKHKAGVSGRIYSLAVGPGHRGKGVGKMLLEAMVGKLAERGARRVYLEVEEGNEGAVRLYEKCGFRRIGVLADYYGAGRNGVHMMREIERLAGVLGI